MRRIEEFLENIEFINKSIKKLLNEEGIITLPNGSNAVKEKYIVIADGQTPNDKEINLKDAKKYKTDVEVGEEIEIEVIDMNDMDDSQIEEWMREKMENGELSWEDIEQLALGASSGKVRRTAGRVFKVGPKVIKAAGRLLLLKGLKKEIRHSQCYCVKLFDANIDSSDADIDKHKPSRDVYESRLGQYIDTVRDEFLKGWDQCQEDFDKFVDRPNAKDAKVERNKALDACPAIDDWVSNAKDVLNKILGDLGKFYNIKGIEVKKKTLAGGEQSIAKQIGKHRKIQLHFDDPVPLHAGGGNYSWSPGDETFTIGTYTDTGNVVKLIRGSKIFYFEFQKAELSQRQTGSVWEDDGSGNKPKSNPVTWKGYIVKFID